MLLAIDIGNSTVVARLVDSPTPWTATWPTRSTDPAGAVRTCREARGLGPLTAALASVVPSVTGAWRQALAAAGARVLQVGVEVPLPLPLDYATPDTLGVDRVLAAAGAVARHGAPVIVAGCGTATTLQVVDRAGCFRGGAILPGLELQRDSLAAGGEQLVAVPLRAPGRAVGRDTTTSLQSGLVYGHAGAIAGLAARMRAELGLARAPLIGTGGLAGLLAAAVPGLFEAVWPELVIEGLVDAVRQLEAGR